jgi:hypothetical protein
VYRVGNYQAKNQLRVMCALIEKGSLVLDDDGCPAAFNTTVQNPMDPLTEAQKNLPENIITQLTTANPSNGMSNKARGGDIIF